MFISSSIVFMDHKLDLGVLTRFVILGLLLSLVSPAPLISLHPSPSSSTSSSLPQNVLLDRLLSSLLRPSDDRGAAAEVAASVRGETNEQGQRGGGGGGGGSGGDREDVLNNLVNRLVNDIEEKELDSFDARSAFSMGGAVDGTSPARVFDGSSPANPDVLVDMNSFRQTPPARYHAKDEAEVAAAANLQRMLSSLLLNVGAASSSSSLSSRRPTGASSTSTSLSSERLVSGRRGRRSTADQRLAELLFRIRNMKAEAEDDFLGYNNFNGFDGGAEGKKKKQQQEEEEEHNRQFESRNRRKHGKTNEAPSSSDHGGGGGGQKGRGKSASATTKDSRKEKDAKNHAAKSNRSKIGQQEFIPDYFDVEDFDPERYG